MPMVLELASLVALVQVALPPPRGYVNDFAQVLDAASAARMDALVQEVRAKTRGDIAVVTLRDLGGRPASEVAVRIGREWGVGAKGEAGDPAKNLGVVILLVPRRDRRPGTGDLFIATGRGAEGFLTDARVGRIRDAMIPYLAREDYAAGLRLGLDLVAQAFAEQFGVTLSRRGPSPPPLEPAPEPGASISINWAFWVIVALWIVLALASRRRRRRWVWLGSGWGGGWGGGWSRGGGGGGGFGGFGGGGGFSGGGAGGKF